MDAVLVGEEDLAFTRGNYGIVQKYLHDLERGGALSTEAQERIIGRTKLSDIELNDSDVRGLARGNIFRCSRRSGLISVSPQLVVTN